MAICMYVKSWKFTNASPTHLTMQSLMRSMHFTVALADGELQLQLQLLKLPHRSVQRSTTPAKRATPPATQTNGATRDKADTAK